MHGIRARCTCTLDTGCGEGTDAGCDYCARDNYEACPIFGYMCWPIQCAGRAEPCCTPEQQRMTQLLYRETGVVE